MLRVNVAIPIVEPFSRPRRQCSGTSLPPPLSPFFPEAGVRPGTGNVTVMVIFLAREHRLVPGVGPLRQPLAEIPPECLIAMRISCGTRRRADLYSATMFRARAGDVIQQKILLEEVGKVNCRLNCRSEPAILNAPFGFEVNGQPFWFGSTNQTPGKYWFSIDAVLLLQEQMFVIGMRRRFPPAVRKRRAYANRVNRDDMRSDDSYRDRIALLR